jgi:hypothetical protein
MPLIFQGRVTIGGEDAPAGTIISAEIQGEEVGTNAPQGTTEAGDYSIEVKGNANIGDMVVLKVNGIVATQHEYVDPWETPIVELDLSIASTATYTYTLTLSSTEGGSVTKPGEGSSTHEAGEVVKLVASADEGCTFDEWTGDVSTVADVHDPTTTITMDADKSVTAAFSTGAAPPTGPTSAPPTEPTPPSPTPPSFGGLGTGGLIGIIVAVVAIIAAVVLIRRRRAAQ